MGTNELTQKEIKDRLRNSADLSAEEIKELLEMQRKLNESSGLSKKEIEAILRKPPQERYIYSVKRIAEQEEAWTLKNEEAVVAGDDHGNIFFPIWPYKEFALKCKIEEWEGCELKKLSLHNLTEEILPNLSKEGTKIAVFNIPDDPVSITVSANDFLNNLLYECSKYE